jgi:exosortase
MEDAAVSRRVPATARAAAAIAAVGVAYYFSLGTLASDWRHDTPLAHLILVPPLAAALLLGACFRHRHVASFRLGRLDLLFAALFFVPAVLIVAAGPLLWSKYFWAMRLDLLTLPLFAAAAVVLLFGSRALVPLAFPLGFLLLAWPLPYLAALEHALDAFTNATAAAVADVAALTSVAAPVAGTGEKRYLIVHEGAEFVVSVASACSGVNSLVGFLVVGVAALWLVRGPVLLRVAWLLAGAALVWALNVVRIVTVLVVAQRFGEEAAFELLHPVAGIIALNLAFVVLLAALPLFRLQRRPLGVDEDEAIDTPLARSAPPRLQATPMRVTMRLALLVAATAALALANGQLASSAVGFDGTGRPAVVAFVDRPATPGWRAARVERIGWARQYYGRDSTWIRYRLRPAGPPKRNRAFTVWADAVVSADLGALNAHTLARCYSFHGYRVEADRHVELGTGVTGQLFVYRTPRAVWHALAWQSPVLHAGRVQHERIVLLASARVRPKAGAQEGRSSLASTVLGLLDVRAPQRDPNPALSRALTRLGNRVVAGQLAKERRT